MSTQSPRKTVGARKLTTGSIAAVAVLGLLAAGPVPGADAAPATTGVATIAPIKTSALPKLPSGLEVETTNTSLLGTHTWYRQMLDGYPVVGGQYAVHSDTSGPARGTSTVWDGRVKAGSLNSSKAAVAATTARATALAATGGRLLSQAPTKLWALPGTSGSTLVWAIYTETGGDAYCTYVDASTGKVVRSFIESLRDKPAADYVNGSANVFDPNPVVKLQDESLTDDDDANSAVPAAGYSKRVLANLLKGSTKLVGRWAKVTNTGTVASSADHVYNYKRHDDRFEQVMAYYALDTEQMFYRRLGFTDINAEPQKIETNTFSDDNSFYSSGVDKIETGTGGVDDAEDPEVVWHEDGHATLDAMVPGFGTGSQGSAIHEGFGDYIAVTMSQQFAKSTAVTPTPCVMDWDATSYTDTTPHCLRVTNSGKHYPEDLEGEGHADGEIWSQALWTINRTMGRTKGNRAILEGQFNFAPSDNMPKAAQKIVTAAKKLYGAQGEKQAKAAFVARGIL